MIESFWLENFKAFGERQTIPLKKITLLFGANSAGKSSILQALLLLKQSLSEADDAQEALLPKGSVVDLGSVSEMTYRHESDRSIRFGFTAATSSPRRERPLSQTMSGTFAFATEGRRGLTLSDFCVEEDRLPVLKFVPVRRSGSGQSILERRATRVAGQLLEQSAQIVRSAYLAYTAKLEPLMEELAAAREGRNARAHAKFTSRHIMPLFSSLLDEHAERELQSPEDVAHVIQKQIVARLEKLSSYDEPTFVDDLTKALTRTDLSWFGLRLRGPREEPVTSRRWSLAPETDIVTAVAGFTADVTRELLRIGYVGPYRATPERLYIFPGIDPRDVGRSGQNLPHLLYKHPGLVKKLNGWFERMEVGYQLDVKKSSAADIEGVFTLRMQDATIGESVSWADVGFGISQLLPILVQAVMPENRLILVEQPELHLHPRLQAEFGSLLAEAIRTEGANRFLIETHSEHLILRLQRLIRLGKLAAEDVGVVHVRRGPGGSIAKILRMDQSGQFIDRWPDGFFEEGFIERFSVKP